MSAKTRIILIVLIPLLLTAAAVSMHIVSSRTATRAESTLARAESMAAAFAKLQLLVQEHAIHLDQRGTEQWSTAYALAGKALEDATPHLVDKADKTAGVLITKSYRNIGYLFNQYGNQQGGGRFSARITTRIVQELQQATPEIDGIRARNRAAATSAISASGLISLALLAVSTLFTIIAAAYLYRGIAAPISVIREALQALAHGDTAFRIAHNGNDEFGQLASEFNRMAEGRQKEDAALKEAEQRASDTFECLNVPAAVMDSTGMIQLCNRHLLEITGRHKSDVTGKNWFDIFMPDNTPAKQLFYQMVSKGEAQEETRVGISTKTGARLTVLWNYSLQRDLTGGPVTSVVITGRDITGQLAREGSLEKRLNLLQSLVDATPESMILLSRDGTVVAVNNGAAELFNRKTEDLAGANYYRLLPPDLEKERKNIIEQVFTSSTPADFNDIQGLSNLEHHAFPVKDRDRSVMLVALFSFDVSSKKLETQDMAGMLDSLSETKEELNASNSALKTRADETLRRNQTLEQLAEQNRVELERLSEELKVALEKNAAVPATSRTGFLAKMSHEIRTPMNAILGLVQLALQTNLTSKQKEYLDSINRSARALIMVINDILDFSRIESGSMALEYQPFSLREVVERSELTVRIHAIEKGLSLATTVHPDIPDNLAGDPLRLEQILANLLGNAIKFSENGEVRLNVAAAASDTREKIKLVFSVEDKGIGMEEEQISRLFTPFSQGDNSSTRRHGGTGLGLSICRHLVELMGGEITVESSPGAGSRFSFTAFFEPGPKNQTKTKKPRKISEKAVYLALQGKRVLVVEDNQINMMVVRELLENSGMIVETAKNGLEATELVKDHGDRFSCVLMDIQMPIMDGIEATRIIRQTHSFEKLPVFAMTAHNYESDRPVCIEAGMNGHITKPLNTIDLVDLITGHVTFSDIPVDASEEVIWPETTETDPVLPASIPGIEIELALQRLDGNRLLLARLIRLFVQEHGVMGVEIAQLIREGDLVAAARLAHSLKGVATNLAAEELRQVTEQLETALKNGDRTSIDAVFARFESSLRKVCSAAEELKGFQEVEVAGDDVSTSSTAGCLERLRLSLQTNDLAARQIFIELRNRVIATADRRKLDRLAESIDRLDYKQALATLEEITNDKETAPKEDIL